MNILLAYPEYPDSFWSFTHVLRFISRKAAVPPLGLVTVSAMLPSTRNKKLIDLNVTSLRSSDIAWADYVFISAMYIQKESVNKILEECLKNKVKVVAGGPLFTHEHNNYPQIDHFVLNEAEITLPLFLNDLALGNTPQHIYKTSEYADITKTPVPDYHLLSAKDYAFMNVQVSRGCPYNCDFCEITALLGHKVRMKSPRQIINELLEGYNKILVNIYSPKPYYQRIRQCLNHYKRPKNGKAKVQLNNLTAFVKSVFILGVASRGRREYWKLMFWTLFRKPRLIIDAITFAVYGYHFRTVYGLRNKSK